MTKKLLALVFIIFVGTAGAFAYVSFGITGAVYTDFVAWENMKNGEGIFYGPFIEYGVKGFGIGASSHFSFFKRDYSFSQDGSDMRTMMDYDVNIYLQWHILGYKAFLDPFIEGGVGRIADDFMPTEDPDPRTPLMASYYAHVGAGFGLNFASIGIFTKFLYAFPFGTVTGTYTDAGGNTQTYDVEKYPLSNFKILLGAKFIFGKK